MKNPPSQEAPVQSDVPPRSAVAQGRDMIEIRIYLDGWLRKIVAGTGALIAFAAIGTYIVQCLTK